MTEDQKSLLRAAAKGAGYNIRHELDYGFIIDSEDVLINEVWNPYKSVVQLYCLARACKMTLDFQTKQVRMDWLTISWSDNGSSEANAIVEMASMNVTEAATVYKDVQLRVVRSILGFKITDNDCDVSVSDTVSIIELKSGRYVICDGPLCLHNMEINVPKMVNCKLEVKS